MVSAVANVMVISAVPANALTAADVASRKESRSMEGGVGMGSVYRAPCKYQALPRGERLKTNAFYMDLLCLDSYLQHVARTFPWGVGAMRFLNPPVCGSVSSDTNPGRRVFIFPAAIKGGSSFSAINLVFQALRGFGV
jgi:hypothetical protein